MSSLKNFIVEESLRSEHSERYFTFIDQYHKQVLIDLRDELAKSWQQTVRQLKKTYKIDPEAKVAATLKNPDALLDTLLITVVEKIISSRSSEHVTAAPSVKIPLAFSLTVREMMIQRLIKTAEDTLKRVADDWSEIFKIEKKGKLQPAFRVIGDHDESRLQLMVNTGTTEVYKTLYVVRVEYGKKSSKTKDFDRVYLTSMI